MLLSVVYLSFRKRETRREGAVLQGGWIPSRTPRGLGPDLCDGIQSLDIRCTVTLHRIRCQPPHAIRTVIAPLIEDNDNDKDNGKDKIVMSFWGGEFRSSQKWRCEELEVFHEKSQFWALPASSSSNSRKTNVIRPTSSMLSTLQHAMRYSSKLISTEWQPPD